MNDLLKKSEILFDKCSECCVSSVTENGYPRICILKPIKNDGIKYIYFATSTNSKKVRQYLKNNKAGVTFYKGGDSVTLTGTMEVLTDKIEKDPLWQEWLTHHFENGGKDDPEYAVIKFESQTSTVYIDGEFDTVSVIYNK